MSIVSSCGSDANPTVVFPLNGGYPISYHGGGLLSAANLYVIFYGGGLFWDGSKTAIYQRALSYLGTSSYFQPAIDIVKTQLSSASLFFKNSIHFYGPPFMNSLASHQSSLSFAITSSGMVDDLNGLYVMVLDPGYSKPSNFKIDSSTYFDSQRTGFCGYHNYYSPRKGVKRAYAVVGTGGKACNWNLSSDISTPNAGFVDVTLSVITHEIVEMFTNPYDNGFYDDLGYENGDKCGGYLGGLDYISGTSGKAYNVVLGGTKFLLQAQYHMAEDTCPDSIYD
jgi:hypothetical protein